MIVVDAEFSGVDPQKNSLLSIGALDFYNPTNQFYGECRVFDGAHIEKEALRINGFTDAEARDPHKKTEGELVKEFLHWTLQCEEHTLAGHNVSGDLAFLRAAALRAHLDWSLAHRVIDLHTMTYFHLLKRGIKPPSKHHRSDLDSDAVSLYVGIPKEPKPHLALNGAKQAAECFSRLIHDKPLFDEFKKYEVPWRDLMLR